MTLRVTILGCGASGGVPRIGNDWGECDQSNPKNNRRRCSIFVEKIGPNGTTQVLIDTGPDMREQMLSAKIKRLDAVIYTHDHADHLNGIDDIRVISINRGSMTPIWADKQTTDSLLARFGYVAIQPEGSDYRPIVELNEIVGNVEIIGAGGTICFEPISVIHGRITALGFRIDDLAYIPDANEIPESEWSKLENLKVWIVDALRYKPHPSHAHLEQTLEWIERAKPDLGILTNMNVELDYEVLKNTTPENVTPAFDGMVIEV